jgi:hypothetical protein
VGGVGGVEHGGPGLAYGVGSAVVDVAGGVIADAGVAVGVVVPVEEDLTEGSGVGEGPEAFGELGPVLEGLELALAVGVVVADVGPAVGLGHSEIGEEQGDGLGGHGGPSVGVDGELARSDGLLGDGVGDEPLGQGGRLAGGQEPPGHVAAVDVEDHVEVVGGPLGRTGQLGDVPGPHLVRSGRDQLGLDVGGMAGLAATFAHLAVAAELPVHGGHRGQVGSLVEQRGVHAGRGQVDETRRVEDPA